jgi:hypothetical protein
MDEPAPTHLPLHEIDGVCPFCNEALARLWRDPAREDYAYQVRCGMCDARGPWGDEAGAVEAWRSVRAIEI